MSTEATGDGPTDAVGAAEADVAAAGTEPSVTVVAEPEGTEPAEAEPAATAPTAWDTAVPSAWGTETSESDETSETANAAAPAEAEDADESVADYEDDEAAEYGGTVEDDEEYDGEYEAEEAEDVAKPRRARRWPRLLLALGFVVLGAAIVGGAVAIVGSVTHGFKKPVKVTYMKSPLFSLKTGDCFDPRGQSYSLLSCNSPHEAEVFATFTLSGSKWPGDAAVAKDASAGCATRLTGYLNPQLTISLSQAYVYPDSVAWQAGTRTVICEVRAQSGQLTGSVRAASATAG